MLYDSGTRSLVGGGGADGMTAEGAALSNELPWVANLCLKMKRKMG